MIRKIILLLIIFCILPLFKVQAALWTPSEITTNVWYDTDDADTLWADIGATVYATSTVARIDDKSGNDAHTSQVDDTIRPITGTRDINGVNVIDFDYGDWLETASNFSTPSDGEMMVFIVADPDDRNRSSQTDDSILSLMNSSAPANNFISIIPYSTTEFSGLHLFSSSEGTFADLFQNAPHNGPSIYSWTKEPVGGFSSYVDGVDVYPGEGDDLWEEQSLDLIWIGRSRYNSSSYMDYAMGELIVAPVNDDNNREKIEGYLAHKWGLEVNLPNGHPYESSAPTAPPVTPTGLTSSQVSTSTITFSWDSVNGVDGYEISLDGAVATTQTATTTIYSGLTPNTEYEFSVSSYDSDGTSTPATLSETTDRVYSVSYNGNGNTSGSGPSTVGDLSIGDPVVISGPADFVKEGYSFNFWYDQYDPLRLGNRYDEGGQCNHFLLSWIY